MNKFLSVAAIVSLMLFGVSCSKKKENHQLKPRSAAAAKDRTVPSDNQESGEKLTSDESERPVRDSNRFAANEETLCFVDLWGANSFDLLKSMYFRPAVERVAASLEDCEETNLNCMVNNLEVITEKNLEGSSIDNIELDKFNDNCRKTDVQCKLKKILRITEENMKLIHQEKRGLNYRSRNKQQGSCSIDDVGCLAREGWELSERLLAVYHGRSISSSDLSAVEKSCFSSQQD